MNLMQVCRWIIHKFICESYRYICQFICKHVTLIFMFRSICKFTPLCLNPYASSHLYIQIYIQIHGRTQLCKFKFYMPIAYASFLCESYASLNEIHMQVIGKPYPYMQVHIFMFRSIFRSMIVYTNLCIPISYPSYWLCKLML